MCRNIKRLYNFEPPATREEVHEASLQYVRKLSGMNKPSQVNQDAFDEAVAAIEAATHRLLDALETRAAPRSREDEARRAKERGQQREARARALALQQIADEALR